MPRERLPNRRAAENFEFNHRGHRIIVNVGYYDDGRPGEVFVVSAGKSGSELNIEMLGSSTHASIALQYGSSVRELADACPRDERGVPENVVGRAMVELLSKPNLRAVT